MSVRILQLAVGRGLLQWCEEILPLSLSPSIHPQKRQHRLSAVMPRSKSRIACRPHGAEEPTNGALFSRFETTLGVIPFRRRCQIIPSAFFHPFSVPDQPTNQPRLVNHSWFSPPPPPSASFSTRGLLHFLSQVIPTCCFLSQHQLQSLLVAVSHSSRGAEHSPPEIALESQVDSAKSRKLSESHIRRDSLKKLFLVLACCWGAPAN